MTTLRKPGLRAARGLSWMNMEVRTIVQTLRDSGDANDSRTATNVEAALDWIEAAQLAVCGNGTEPAASLRALQLDEAAELREDTPCLEDGVDNCNDSGTGEGRYHGRM